MLQKLHRRDRTTERSVHQGRPAVPIRGIEPCASAHQEFHHAHTIELAGQVQRGRPKRVYTVHVRTRCNKPGDILDPSFFCRRPKLGAGVLCGAAVACRIRGCGGDHVLNEDWRASKRRLVSVDQLWTQGERGLLVDAAYAHS